jgi:hypothetical protein
MLEKYPGLLEVSAVAAPHTPFDSSTTTGPLGLADTKPGSVPPTAVQLALDTQLTPLKTTPSPAEEISTTELQVFADSVA